MSQKVSQALIRLLNEISSTETTLSKVQAVIFVKKSEKIIDPQTAPRLLGCGSFKIL